MIRSFAFIIICGKTMKQNPKKNRLKSRLFHDLLYVKTTYVAISS